MVQVYAEQIFGLGRELLDAVRDRPTGQPLRLQVGIADMVPKQLASRLLAPARKLEQPVRLVVREDQPERLLAELALFDLDLVISEAPPRGSRVKVFQHELGQSGVGVFGNRKLAAKARKGFPAGLESLPFLLPLEHSELRRDVDDWLRARELQLQVVGEFEDAALLQTFAGDGAGLMFAPTVLQRDVKRQHGLELAGALAGVQVRYFAVTVERRITHPAVAAILQAARHEVFAAD
jgi:LysR family transcriptional activator of nhaA